MTSLSEALVNGANIALNLRKQAHDEEVARLDESYRRDVRLDRNKQFEQDLGFRKDALGQADRHFNENLKESARQSNARIGLGYAENATRNRAIADAEKRTGLVERDMDYKETEAYSDELAQYVFSYKEQNGEPPSEAELMAMMVKNPVGRKLLDRMGLPTVSAADGKTVFDQVTTAPDGTIIQFGVHEDGTPAIPDSKRTARKGQGDGSPVTYAPGKFYSLLMAAGASSPSWLKRQREHGAYVAGLKPEDVTDDQALEIIRDDAQSKVDAETQTAEAAQQPSAPPTEAERLAALEKVTLGTGARPPAVAGSFTPSPVIQRGAAALAAPPPAPPAQTPPAQQRETLGVRDPRAEAERSRQAGWQRIRLAQQMGYKPTLGDLSAAELSGGQVLSESLLADMDKAQADRAKADAASDEKLTSALKASVDAAFSGADDKFTDKGQAIDDLLQLNEISGRRAARDQGMLLGYSALLRRAQEYGGEDFRGPQGQPYRVGFALGAANASLRDASQDEAEQGLEAMRRSQAEFSSLQERAGQRPTGLSPGQMALLTELSFTTDDPAQISRTKQIIYSLTPADASMVAGAGGLGALAKMSQGQ